jgi:hypothetical protein
MAVVAGYSEASQWPDATVDSEERAVFDSVAGGRAPPINPVKEIFAGRRSGKSRMAAASAVNIATADHSSLMGVVTWAMRQHPAHPRSDEFGCVRSIASGLARLSLKKPSGSGTPKIGYSNPHLCAAKTTTGYA